MRKKKNLAIYLAVLLACILMAFSLTGISFGMMKNETLVKEGKSGDSAGGKTILMAEGKKRTIPLTGSSINKVMAPPCTVTAVKGKNVTLRDFKGQVDVLEVADISGIRIGDKGVVKNGNLIIGIVPE